MSLTPVDPVSGAAAKLTGELTDKAGQVLNKNVLNPASAAIEKHVTAPVKGYFAKLFTHPDGSIKWPVVAAGALAIASGAFVMGTPGFFVGIAAALTGAATVNYFNPDEPPAAAAPAQTVPQGNTSPAGDSPVPQQGLPGQYRPRIGQSPPQR